MIKVDNIGVRGVLHFLCRTLLARRLAALLVIIIDRTEVSEIANYTGWLLVVDVVIWQAVLLVRFSSDRSCWGYNAGHLLEGLRVQNGDIEPYRGGLVPFRRRVRIPFDRLLDEAAWYNAHLKSSGVTAPTKLLAVHVHAVGLQLLAISSTMTT